MINGNNIEMQSFNKILSSTPKPTLTPPPQVSPLLLPQQKNSYYGTENWYCQPQEKFNYQSPAVASTSTPIQQTTSYSLYRNSTPILSPQWIPQKTQNCFIDPSYQYHFQNTENFHNYSQNINSCSSQYADSNYFSETNSVLGSYETNYENVYPKKNLYYDDSAAYESPINDSNTKTNKLFTIDSILNSKRTENINKENMLPLVQERSEETNDELDEYQVKGKKGGRHGSKRVRTIFTQEQLDRLEVEFMKQQYMVGSERYYLANELNLNEAQVKIWFQNRRIKWRKENVEQKRCIKQKDTEDDNSISNQPQSPISIYESVSNQ